MKHRGEAILRDGRGRVPRYAVRDDNHIDRLLLLAMPRAARDLLRACVSDGETQPEVDSRAVLPDPCKRPASQSQLAAPKTPRGELINLTHRSCAPPLLRHSDATCYLRGTLELPPQSSLRAL